MTLLRHLNSSSRCQNWYQQLTLSGIAVFQLPFPTFQANLSGVLCTKTVEATMPVAAESYRDVTISLWLYGSKQTLGQNTYDHAAAAVISLAHSAVTYWSCFAIHKHLRHLKNMNWLLRHGIYTCIYCVKIFSWWNVPKKRSEVKIGQNQCSGALWGLPAYPLYSMPPSYRSDRPGLLTRVYCLSAILSQSTKL